MTTKIFTIGFTGSTAEHFFTRLNNAGITKVIDVRLWANTQLSGFAKKKDLPYFLKELAEIDYEYRNELAPIDDILKAYKAGRISWNDYEVQYLDLINHRNIANIFSPDEVDHVCFLCACKTEHQCHRRLLVEYLKEQWNTPIEVTHL